MNTKRIVKVNELAHLIPTKAGATFSQLWQIFYYIRLLKYVHKKQLPKIKKSFDKICTHDKLQELCALGYLKNPQIDVYCAKDKVLPILKEAGFITETLPSETSGKGDINELQNTEALIRILKQKYYYTFLYPSFGYLIPDALLVQKDSENRKCKLVFLEIEAKKPQWEKYIENKRDNYLRLEKDIQFYNYWKITAPKLGLTIPPIDRLKFSVHFICNIEKDFGKGFTFQPNTKL